MLSSKTADSAISIQPPEHVARPWKRIIARMLDSILVQIIGTIIAVVFVLGNGIISVEQFDELGSLSNIMSVQGSCLSLTEPGCGILELRTEFNLYAYIMIALISLCYFVITTKLSPFATLGKYLMQIQVVSTRGKDITWMQSIMRHLPWFFVDVIMVLFLLYSLDSGQMIPQAGLLQSLFYALILIQMNFTEWSQGFHDMISATAVIQVNPTSKHTKKK